MARFIGKLSALAVTRIKRKGRIADGGGLYLQVTDSAPNPGYFDSCSMAGHA